MMRGMQVDVMQLDELGAMAIKTAWRRYAPTRNAWRGKVSCNQSTPK
jgi:hypothetical protein